MVNILFIFRFGIFTLFIMESNQDSTDNSPETINRNEKVISNENLN